MKVRLKVDTTGKVTGIYSDDYDFDVHGENKKIRRASEVEPNAEGQWEADMSLLGAEHVGVILGPFAQRAEAINAEVEYIAKHLLGSSE